MDALASHYQIPQSYEARASTLGYFGVAIFFIISGFIIYRTSRNSFQDRKAIAEFVFKRLIRILPVYWIATALFVALSPHRVSFSASDLIFSLLLVPHVVAAAGNMHPLVG